MTHPAAISNRASESSAGLCPAPVAASAPSSGAWVGVVVGPGLDVPVGDAVGLVLGDAEGDVVGLALGLVLDVAVGDGLGLVVAAGATPTVTEVGSPWPPS